MLILSLCNKQPTPNGRYTITIVLLGIFLCVIPNVEYNHSCLFRFGKIIIIIMHGHEQNSIILTVY